MRGLADVFGYLNLALYTAVAVVALWQWRRGRGPASLWAALAFGVLALVVDVGRVIEATLSEGTTADAVLTRIIVAGLALFPYFLYRFSAAFRAPPAGLERLLALMTVVVVGWTFALPEIPDEGEPRSAFFTTYLVAFVLHWTVLTCVVGWRLWRAGRGLPGVARGRMRTFAFAALVLTVALLLAAFAPEGGAMAVVTQALSTVAAAAFLLALAPPAALRYSWRREEQARIQEAIGELMGATTEDEVLERVLPPMAAIVGARAVTLRGPDGDVLGTYGETNGERVAIELPGGGTLEVHATAYAPYFGGSELASLRTLGSLTELALDRARLFGQERSAREVLERADELKSNFIALAAHELRNPVTIVHGLVETLDRLADQLSDVQRAEMRSALREQTAHLRALVEQLLDLSRLDADAIAIMPERLSVREHVNRIADFAAGERRGDVDVEVAPELEADIDPQVLERVVSNLVVNALRYGAAPVTISAEQRDRHFRLTVEDRGPGVAPELVPDLFERFTRSSTPALGAGGTGLGLAIARSYARAHRGDLFYEPAQPQGACFRLVLPSTAAA